MAKHMAYLFTGDCGGSVFEVTGDPPTGTYGEDWIVLRAATARDARHGGVNVLFHGTPWDEYGVLTEERAVSEFTNLVVEKSKS